MAEEADMVTLTLPRQEMRFLHGVLYEEANYMLDNAVSDDDDLRYRQLYALADKVDQAAASD